jgi:hypothetical protein
MGRRTKFWVALLLLLTVLAVCISPAVDLEPTALRALRLANLLFAALALVILIGAINRATRPVDAAARFYPLLVTPKSILDLACTRLC